jgi:hypothetical protein
MSEARKHTFVKDAGDFCWRCGVTLVEVEGPCIDAVWKPMDTAPVDGTKIIAIGRIKPGPLDTTPDKSIRACVTAFHASRDESPAFAAGWYWASPGYCAAFEPLGWVPLTSGTEDIP